MHMCIYIYIYIYIYVYTYIICICIYIYIDRLCMVCVNVVLSRRTSPTQAPAHATVAAFRTSRTPANPHHEAILVH